MILTPNKPTTMSATMSATRFFLPNAKRATLAQLMAYVKVLRLTASIDCGEDAAKRAFIHEIQDRIVREVTPLALQFTTYITRPPFTPDIDLRTHQLVFLNTIYQLFHEYMSELTTELKVAKLTAVDRVHKILRDLYEEKHSDLSESTHVLLHCGAKEKITPSYMGTVSARIGEKTADESDLQYFNRFMEYCEGLNSSMSVLTTLIPSLLQSYQTLSREVLLEWRVAEEDLEIRVVGGIDDYVSAVMRLSRTRGMSA